MAPQLRDEGQLVEVPDDAGSIPRAADHDAVRRRRRQTRHAVCVSQQRLESQQATAELDCVHVMNHYILHHVFGI